MDRKKEIPKDDKYAQSIFKYWDFEKIRNNWHIDMELPAYLYALSNKSVQYM